MNTEQRDTNEKDMRLMKALANALFDEWKNDDSSKVVYASHLNQSEPNKADPKHIPTSFSEWLEQNNDSIDIGGNWTPDRVQANHDFRE